MSDDYQDELLHNRFAKAALSVGKQLQFGPEGRFLMAVRMWKLAGYLQALDAKRQDEKGKPMSDDHLKQEAVKWAREQIATDSAKS